MRTHEPGKTPGQDRTGQRPLSHLAFQTAPPVGSGGGSKRVEQKIVGHAAREKEERKPEKW